MVYNYLSKWKPDIVTDEQQFLKQGGIYILTLKDPLTYIISFTEVETNANVTQNMEMVSIKLRVCNTDEAIDRLEKLVFFP